MPKYKVVNKKNSRNKLLTKKNFKIVEQIQLEKDRCIDRIRLFTDKEIKRFPAEMKIEILERILDCHEQYILQLRNLVEDISVDDFKDDIESIHHI